MARFFGEVGYGESVEQAPGVYDDVITERIYQGDVIRNTYRVEGGGDQVNQDISLSHSIAIVADEHAIKHSMDIKYVRLEGVLWSVTSVEVRAPRLILSLGSVYNGPTPTAPDPA
jgi:hypothetical protein